MENPYLYVIVLLHAGFAGALLLFQRHQPSRFVKRFAWSWGIEAVRAAILLPDVHNLGGRAGEWFCLADVLCFFANWFLFSACADLSGVRLPRWLAPVYFSVSIPLVLLGRYAAPIVLRDSFGWTWEQGRFHGVLGNLIVMFVPVTAARITAMFWLFRLWRRTKLPGALIASVFCVPYAVIAMAVPFQFYFSYNPSWVSLLWVFRVFGFSIGIVMLLLSQQQSALQWSEKRLRAIIENEPDSVHILGVDGSLLEMNRAGLLMIEADSFEQVAGKCFYSLVVEEHRSAFRELVETVFGGKSGIREFEIIGLKGGRRWLETHAIPWRDERDQIAALLGITRDVTERRNSAESQRRNEAVLRLFVEHSPAAIAMFNQEMQYLVVSRRYLEDYGLVEQSLVGRSHYDVFPEIPDRWKETHRRCLAGAIEKADEDPFPRADGRLDWVRWEIRPWRESDGRIGGIILFSEVNTERKRTEATLRNSESRYRLLVQNSPYCIHEIDKQGRFISMNQAGLAMLCVQDELAIQGMCCLETVSDADKERVGGLLNLALQGKPTVFEFVAVNKAYFQSSFVPIRDEAGNVMRLMGLTLDITERKRAEHQIEMSREQLRSLLARLRKVREEERTRVAREIHDELGQLLTGLKMDVRWIERKLSAPGLPPALNPLLDRVVAASELADATIAAVQKIAAELRSSALDNLGLEAALSQKASSFQERTGVPCALVVEGMSPELTPEIANELFYICQEALTNVTRHAHATRVEIHLRTDGDALVLDVRDDGVGVNASDLHSRHSLGLVGMRERALQCGGTVTFERNEPRGTRVVVRVGGGGMRNAECGMRNAECGMRNAECGMRNA